MKFFWLVFLLASCGKPLEVVIAATKSSTVTLTKTGKLSVRLEIRRLGQEVNTIALMTWAGNDSASVDTRLEQYQYTSKVKSLRNLTDSMEFESGQTRLTGTPALLEPSRTCATLTLAVSSFNANADEVLENTVLDACEKP